MKSFAALAATTALALAATGPIPAQAEDFEMPERQYRDVRPDTWAAVDGLGRAVPMAGEVPEPREDRIVGIFYFTWHGPHGYDNNYNPPDEDVVQAPLPKRPGHAYRTPFNLMERIAASEDGIPELGPEGWWHYWGEPRWGYYLSDDEWVLRKNAEMLSDAGVDVLFFDTTNGFTYLHTVDAMCRIFTEMRERGERTPQIAFIAWNNHMRATTQAYEAFYKPGRHREFWFHWQGKPLILTNNEGLPDEIREFFTIRESWAWKHAPWFGDGHHKWPWLDDYPQAWGWDTDPEVPEFMSAAVASHPTRNRGRSFHNGAQPPQGELRSAENPHFEEQMSRVLEVDPQVLFVTGWNEWIALRFPATREQVFANRTVRPGDGIFVDVYNEEFHRDMEPMRGGYGDASYYQLVSALRRFKGARAPEPAAPAFESFDPADPSAWDAAGPLFLDHIGDTIHRDHPGWGRVERIVNTTGRNDIAECRIARDAARIHFLAECADELTPQEDATWMRLFLRDENAGDDAPSWEGYHWLLQRDAATGEVLVGRSRGGWDWELAARGESLVDGARVVYSVDRADLGLSAEPIALQFKWTDNAPMVPDIVDFLDHGDAAPPGRFNFVYRAE